MRFTVYFRAPLHVLLIRKQFDAVDFSTAAAHADLIAKKNGWFVAQLGTFVYCEDRAWEDFDFERQHGRAIMP